MADYDRPDNPLFIPETRFRTGSLFWALGHHRALGFSVFGIEDGRLDSQLARAYALLRPLSPGHRRGPGRGPDRRHPARRGDAGERPSGSAGST